MIEIDGSRGGGQILRTATSLAALEDKKVKVKNIRGSRPNPGLKEQHLKGLRAIARACNGRLKGDSKASETVELHPGGNINREIKVHIETAGSVGLVLQQIIPLAIEKPIEVQVNGGGTYGKWAPPVDYLKLVFLPLLEDYGYTISLKIDKEGFYPKGGAKVRLEAEKANPENIEIEEKGEIEELKGISKATEHLKSSKVAERQAKSASQRIEKKLETTAEIKTDYVKSQSIGSGLVLATETNKTIIGSDSLGERGKRSEEVGKKASKRLIREIRGAGTVDTHLADQLIPYMAYAPGESVIKSRKITDHIQTNMRVTEAITGKEFQVKGKKIVKRG